MHAFRYFALLSMLTGTAAAGSMPQRNAQGLLVSDTGRTLYSYAPDGTSGASRCNDACAAVWPPYVIDKGMDATGDYCRTTRADGASQWVYRGQPLYLFVGDDKPGDHDGDGVNGSWHVVR